MKKQAIGSALLALSAAGVLACGDSSSSGNEPTTASGAAQPSEPSGPTATPGATDAPATPPATNANGAGSEGGPAPGGVVTAPETPASTPSPEVADALSSSLTTAVEQGQIPGVVALVVNREGVLFEGAAGSANVAAGVPMATDAIFNIASMTKPVTSVAVMQLVEQGQLGLDDAVADYLPQFADREVLASPDVTAGAIQTQPATVVMTLRHLLSHTSGIGYGFASATVAQLQQATPGASELDLPLLAEPGAEWHYSASTRALGLIVEQVSGQTLEDYFQEHIFEPLGMLDTSYAVPADQQARIPSLHVRGAGGTLTESPQNAPPSPTPPFTGDGGLYSTAHDYGQFMRMFLNAGSLDGAQILSPESVQQMGENQIGAIFVEQQGANPMLTNPFPLGAGQDKFGLGFQLTSEASADGIHRSAGSMAWAGLFNTEFWIDPSAGIAATHLMQVLPFYDNGAIEALLTFEAAVYAELVK